MTDPNPTGSKRARVQKFYDGEAVRYLDDRYRRDSCEQLSYLFRMDIVVDFLAGASGNALDLGCGPAVYTWTLVDLGLQVTSVDLSYEMLLQARALAPAGFQGDWVNSEIDRLPLKDEVADTVLAIGVLAYADKPARALAEFPRCMRPEATLILQCSNVLSPTAAAYLLKDRILIAAGLRKRAYDFTLNRYRLGSLLTELERVGLRPQCFRRYDFRLPFLDRIAPRLAAKIMTVLQRKLAASGLLGWIGEGFVIKAQRQ